MRIRDKVIDKTFHKIQFMLSFYMFINAFGLFVFLLCIFNEVYETYAFNLLICIMLGNALSYIFQLKPMKKRWDRAWQTKLRLLLRKVFKS